MRSVERHITHIYAKIGARGNAGATAYALRNPLTPAGWHEDAEDSKVSHASTDGGNSQ